MSKQNTRSAGVNYFSTGLQRELLTKPVNGISVTCRVHYQRRIGKSGHWNATEA